MRRLQPPGYPPTERQRSLSRWQKAALLPTIALALSSCIYDSDKRCGGGQVVYTGGMERCVCDANSAWTQSGCVTCGADEVPGPAGCTCKEGYGRSAPTAACSACGQNETANATGACGCKPGFGRIDPNTACAACGENEITGATGACECTVGYGRTSPQEACAPLSPALGKSCDTQSEPCTDTQFNYCHAASGTQGYCTTQGCTTSDDCVGGYTCEVSASPTYCGQPATTPVGLGKPCKSDADCAGTEATYCDLFVTMGCLVQGCTMAPDNCPSGYECCDLSAFSVPKPLCVSIALGGCTT
jgi:hypothetical protein